LSIAAAAIVAALAEAIVKVAHQDPADRTERLSEARRVAVQEYDEAVSARRLLELYQVVVSEAKNLKADGDRL
jgi:glycosyltransferase involved in cell wall biosynthesis